MKQLKCLSILAGVAASALTGFIASASADELVLSSWLPPKHPLVTDVMEPWAAEVAKATDGRVTVRILPKPVQHDIYRGVGISVIIPAKYEDAYIVKTLKYIFESTPPNLLYEVLSRITYFIKNFLYFFHEPVGHVL